MKTAVEDFIETIENALKITIDDQTKAIYLEKEKQQIIEAHRDGMHETIFIGTDVRKKGEQYYNETYNK